MSKITDHLTACVADGTALAAFNAPGFDAMVGIGKAANDSGRAVIIQVSARLVIKHGAPAVKAWFDTAKAISGGTCFLHLDHCADDAVLAACIAQGWDMVMFDGSQLPIDENCARSAALVKLAHATGTAVEGEVGPIGGEEDGHEAAANTADPDDIVRLGTETGIDCIAVGFGNVHGDYASKTHLRWDVYEAAQSLCNLPLVLHGGSGLTDAEFFRAIRAGSAKINISTDLKKAYVAAVADPDLLSQIPKNPSALHDRLEQIAREVAHHYIDLFQSAPKAS